MISNIVEWDGLIHNEKTKRGYDIMRLSKKGNVRIVYRKDMIQGKYAIEIKIVNSYGDSFWTLAQGWITSDSLAELDECVTKNMIDAPLEV